MIQGSQRTTFLVACVMLVGFVSFWFLRPLGEVWGIGAIAVTCMGAAAVAFRQGFRQKKSGHKVFAVAIVLCLFLLAVVVVKLLM